MDPAILGTWQMVSEYDVTAGEIYVGDYVTFKQDGTFSMDNGKLVLNLTYVESSSASSWDQRTLSVSINGKKMTVDIL